MSRRRHDSWSISRSPPPRAKTLLDSNDSTRTHLNGVSFVNLTIEFLGANVLPKLDVVGLADPYFVADLDGEVSFISTVIPDTLEPSWNEVWSVLHVPETAALTVELWDKDEDQPRDDYIGFFQVKDFIQLDGKELNYPITGLPEPRQSHFQLRIRCESCQRTKDVDETLYLFDGPIRYSRHSSPFIGRLANIDDGRHYSTWKLYLRQVPRFFSDSDVQWWSKDHKNAQLIFDSIASPAIKRGLGLCHKMLYARTARNGFGTIKTREDLLALLTGGVVGVLDTTITNVASSRDILFDADNSHQRSRLFFPLDRNASHSTLSTLSSSLNSLDIFYEEPHSDPTLFSSPSSLLASLPSLPASPPRRPKKPSTPSTTHRIKPTIYTYILSSKDNSFRFSETGASFFADRASKHALHSKCADHVRYAGEFHLRPAVEGYWDGFDDAITDEDVDWQLVIDNESGTYAPDKRLLHNLKELLVFNFGGLGLEIKVSHHEDEELKRSKEACRRYALEKRGVKRDDLEAKKKPTLVDWENYTRWWRATL